MIKEGWEIKKLGEVAKVIYGYTEKASFDEIGPKFLRITDIQDKGVNWDNVPFCKIKDDDFDKYKLIEGDIVFARTGATTGKSYLVNNPPNAVFASYLIKVHIQNKTLIPEYLFLFFQTKKYWDIIKAGVTGAAQGGFNATKLSELEIPLTPPPEQQRIVTILDECFAAIDKAKVNAEQNLKNAKELFESYLQGVFEKKGDGWEERKLGEKDLIEIVDGDRGKNYPTQNDFMESGFCLFMNTKNVRPDGFVFDTTSFISDVKDNSMGKGKLKRNDVVMTTRGTIGNIGVYDERVNFDNIRINSGMLIFRPNISKILPKYLFETFRSGLFKEQIKKYTTGAAQPQLPIKTLINFTIPIPKSITEQQTIVRQLDALRVETQKLEAVYQQKVADLVELKKSILERAFRGEL